MLKPGQVFNNRYKIISTLGEGGFGAVYKVWDDNLQRFCAIKENLQVSEDAQKQFRREAIMLANLNHPHLVRVTDYFFISDRGQYLVMDYVEGIDLHTALTNYGKALPLVDTMRWTQQICNALIYIHSQNLPIIHRDIKPANIRITPQNNAVLVNFGLAKIFEVNAKTNMGARGLTSYFVAPEQYGTGGLDVQSDIYSLGASLYCMLTNQMPPDSVDIMVGNAEPPPPAKAINTDIPEFVSDALQRAMQIRRTERCKSVSDFKNALLGEQKPFAQVKFVEPPAVLASNFENNKLILSNGIEFVRVPAGKFIMGSNNGDDSEKSQHTVDIPYDYWTSRFPVTNELYNVFAKAKGIEHPVDSWMEEKDHPVVMTNWNDAMEYCKWLNNLFKDELSSGMVVRLPTEAEWEKAARGTDGREYPWGNTFDKNKCNLYNDEKADAGSDIYNTGDGVRVMYGSGKGCTTPIGFYSPLGDSFYGCADMSGNVLEWTHSENKIYPYNVKDGREDEQLTIQRVLRGGSFGDDDSGMFCAYRFGHDPVDTNGDIGFRVVVSYPISKIIEVVEKSLPIEKKMSQISGHSQSNVLSTPTKVKSICVTPPSNKLTLSNGLEFMHVPAGNFLMGSNNGMVNEKPQHIIDIPYDYWMGRYPVTNELYHDYAKYKKIEHPVENWIQKKDHPIVGVSWFGVLEYCKWLNNLLEDEFPSGMIIYLPNEAEWEKAARGTDGREYPWGNTFEKNKCNSKEAGKGDTTPVDLYSPRGNSPYGCADMSGNVSEWTCSLYKPYPFDAKKEADTDWFALRGGSWRDTGDVGDYFKHSVRVSGRNISDPQGDWNDLGFRVALVPLVNYS